MLERRQRNAIVMIVLSLTAIATLHLIVDSRYLGIALVSGSVGLVYVSDFYTPNDNVTYTVSFHGVNFTFMYWIDPLPLVDIDFTVYFLIAFADNSTEEVNIGTGGYWYAIGGATRPINAKTTVDTSPIAGVLYNGYLDSPVGWRFIVSLSN